MRARVAFAVASAFAVATLAWAEVVHARASTRDLPERGAARPTTEAVIVLGYRDHGARANHMNRYRVRVALRSFDPDARNRVLVVCGGAVGGPVPEADLLAEHARRRGYSDTIRADAQSRTTGENIRLAIPLVEDADSIKIASHAPHAAVGRALLREMRPDLALRLRRADDYRFGETPLIKVAAAVLASRAGVQLRMRRIGRRPRR